MRAMTAVLDDADFGSVTELFGFELVTNLVSLQESGTDPRSVLKRIGH